MLIIAMGKNQQLIAEDLQPTQLLFEQCASSARQSELLSQLVHAMTVQNIVTRFRINESETKK